MCTTDSLSIKETADHQTGYGFEGQQQKALQTNGKPSQNQDRQPTTPS